MTYLIAILVGLSFSSIGMPQPTVVSPSHFGSTKIGNESAKVADSGTQANADLNVDTAKVLMKEEDLPIATLSPEKKEITSAFGFRTLLLMSIVFLAAGVASYFFVKFLKNKGTFPGTRKYLIEQLGYCDVGGKAGVSLVKVGREFVLLGVTPQQVTLLSTLPKLEAQYDEETQFERDQFKDAVREELNRIHSSVGQVT